jgi:hypothetical protein
MPNYTERFTETVALLDTINPALVDNAAAETGWVAVKLYRRIIGVVLLGATDIGVTLIRLLGATDGSGTGSTAIKTATNLTATDDNKQVLLEAGIDALTGYTHVKLTATVGNGDTGAQIAGVLLGSVARYADVTHDTTVAQVVV